MDESTKSDKDEIKMNTAVENNEDLVVVEVVEEFEEIPNLKEEVNIESKNKIEDNSPEFIEKTNEPEEEPLIVEDIEIETVVNLKNEADNSENTIKTTKEKTVSDKLHNTAELVSKEASAVYDITKEKLKHGRENLENHEGLEKAFDKSKDVTVNLLEFIKRFVKKPVDTIENVDISLLEISVLAIIQTIIIYFSLEMIDSYSFNFVEVTVVMAIAYVLFIAVVYVVTYAVHTEFDAKYLYKWFATVQMPFVAWSFIGALLFWVSNYYGFVVATSLVGIISSACIGMFSAKKIVNVSRDKLAYIVPVMLIAYAGCMLFIMDQLLWANFRG